MKWVRGAREGSTGSPRRSAAGPPNSSKFLLSFCRPKRLDTRPRRGQSPPARGQAESKAGKRMGEVPRLERKGRGAGMPNAAAVGTASPPSAAATCHLPRAAGHGARKTGSSRGAPRLHPPLLADLPRLWAQVVTEFGTGRRAADAWSGNPAPDPGPPRRHLPSGGGLRPRWRRGRSGRAPRPEDAAPLSPAGLWRSASLRPAGAHLAAFLRSARPRLPPSPGPLRADLRPSPAPPAGPGPR